MRTLRALLLLTLIAVCARGQSLFTLTRGHPKAPGITNLSAVAVTDCSGDRRLDAVIAGKGYQLFYSGADGASLATTTSDPAAFSPASAVVSTDFNSDGIPDIAVAGGAGGVTVFAGQTAAGSCSYSNVASFSAGPGSLPAAMVSADFNRDGKVDLAVASAGANEVRIFLGNGNGTFQSPGSAIVIGTTPKSMVIADFDADGRFDLAVASAVEDKVKILKGDGAGGFVLLAGDNGTSQAGPKGVTAADFNADGKPDLAVTDNGGQSISFLLGNGDGTFTGLHTGAGSYALGYPPVDITTGDFDGDGRPDLAIAIVAHATAGVSVWLGQGNGNFSQAAGSPFATGVGNPAAIVAADLNGDTRPDLWAVGDAGLSVLENAWPGIVAPAQLEFHATVGQNPAAISASLSGAPGPYTVRSTAAWLSAAASGATLTISADTAAMAPGSYSGTVWVTAPGAYGAPIRINLTIAAPSGTLVEAPGSPVTDIGEIPHLADVNLDGKLDLLFTGYPGVSGLEQLRVLLGDGTGGFAPPPSGGTVAVPNPTLLAVADFNGDGRPDAAITSYPRCTLRVYLGDGAGGFTGAVSYQLFAPCPQGIVAADWNLDGKVDLAVERRGSYTIYLGNGDGTFTAGALEASGGCNAPFLATADFNLDGKPDLAFSEGCTPSRVIIRYGDGRGGFPASAAFSKSAGGIYETFAGDLDGDGKPDLAAGILDGANLFLTRSGTPFARSTTFFPAPKSMAGADMNGDGKLDLAGGTDSFAQDSLMVAITDGPFPLTTFNLPQGQFIAAGDLNGDGRTDVVTYRPFATANQLHLLLGAKTPSTST